MNADAGLMMGCFVVHLLPLTPWLLQHVAHFLKKGDEYKHLQLVG
jgi:hypothetical protein